MRLLLDTHVFLWFIEGSPRLSAHARQLIEDGANERLLSIASIWEMAIKVNLGRLKLAQPFHTLIPQQLIRNQINVLGITLEHTALIATLPHHHGDPFDLACSSLKLQWISCLCSLMMLRLTHTILRVFGKRMLRDEF
jgi:PIN domain nuclease of toxin-antitoxin system